MICHQDKTFCQETDCKNFGPCHRSLTEEVKKDAGRAWGGHGAPIAIFTGRPECFEGKE